MATKKMTQAEYIQAVLSVKGVTTHSIEVYELTEVKMTLIRYVKNGVNCCLAFKGNSAKKYFHNLFNSLESMEATIKEKKEYLQNENDSILRYKAECDKQNELIQVGTVLYSSWGVEQTNIDFYLVVERKGNFIKIVELGKHVVVEGFLCGTCTPNLDIKGEKVMRKKITNGSISLASYMGAWVYDGKPKYWSSYA